MADAASKYTVFFEASGGAGVTTGAGVPTGWTETFYSADGLSQASLQKVVNQYVPARAALLGVGAEIKYLRQTSVNNPAQKRISWVQFMQGKQGLPTLFTTTPQDDYDFTAVDLLCRVQDTQGHRRSLWLGGLPDSQVDQLKQQGINGAFVQGGPFKQWTNAILALGFGIRYMVNAISKVGTFGTIQTIQAEDVRRRDRGRPFRLERGRRLA